MSDPNLSDASKRVGEALKGRRIPSPTKESPKPDVTKAVSGKIAEKAGVPKGISPKSLKAERDANKNTSAKQKSGKILKDTIKGATGSSTEGKMVGGGIQGALAGLAKGVMTTTKGRWLLALFLLPILPLLFWFMLISSIGSNVNSLLGNNANQTSSVSNSTGTSQFDLSTIQTAATQSTTPWEIMAATVYYETGPGASVAQISGTCPSSDSVLSICPSVTSTPIAGSSSSAATLSSSLGPVPTPVPIGTCVDANSFVGIGIECGVGRNGSVPAILPQNSSDYTTTNTADWACIRQAESNDVYNNPNSGGAYGILNNTWVLDGFSATSGDPRPYLASPAQQNQAALFILNNNRPGFYPGWDDKCVLNAPGQSGSPTIQAISPGVELPQGSSALVAACPNKATGPYCANYGSLSADQAKSLALSSDWFGTTFSRLLYNTSAGGNINLLQGVITSGGSAPPQFDPTNYEAVSLRKGAIRALEAVPIANNSLTLDNNIYDLAVNWAAGFSPIPGQSCSDGQPSTNPVTVSGPYGSITISTTQLVTAEKILKIAVAARATSLTQNALIIAAMVGSELGQSATYAKDGIFGDGITNLPQAVKNFLKKDKERSLSAAQQATVVGTVTLAIAQSWSSAVQIIVQGLNGTLPNCPTGSPIPNVPGGSAQAQLAVTTAKTVVGSPYVWGGGSRSGATTGLLGLGAPACSNGFVVSSALFGAGNPCDATYASQTGQAGFDCSGLVIFSFGKAGVVLPRTSQEQYKYVESRVAISSDILSLQPGDLLFYFPDSSGLPDHVAIYLGPIPDGTPVTQTVMACTPSRTLSGTTITTITCAPHGTGQYIMTTAKSTPTLIQAPEEGSDVSVVTWYSQGFMGGGPAA